MTNPLETPNKPTGETGDDPIKVRIGRLIASKREDLGLSQRSFADQIGMKRPSLSNVENGRSVSIAVIERIIERWPHLAEELQTAYDDLGGSTDREEDEFDNMIIRRVSATTPLTGTWFALWEATADDEPVPNIEELEIKKMSKNRIQIRNLSASPDNPKGGYLWIAECRLFEGQHLLGSYLAVDHSIRSKGTMHLVIHASGRYFAGQWIGCSYDSDYSHGLVVFSREKEELKGRLKRHRKQFKPYPGETVLQ